MAAPAAPSPPEDLDGVQRICECLRETGRHGDELSCPSFAGRLTDHLRRLSPRYLADHLAAGRAEDILLHWRILDDCYEPDKRPVFHARFVRAVHQEVDDRETTMFLHEIVFSSIDKVKLLHRLTGFLADEIGLNIHEAHVYTTVDGFVLAVFLVDWWETEDAGDLMAKIKDKLPR